jgi:hypothetical protein
MEGFCLLCGCLSPHHRKEDMFCSTTCEQEYHSIKTLTPNNQQTNEINPPQWEPQETL